MFSRNTQKVNQGTSRDRKGKRKVFNDGYNSSNGSLESGDDDPMLASQEIQGPPTAAKTRGNCVVFERLEGKEEEMEKTDQLQQSPKQNDPVNLFLTNVKPRLRWTKKLHAQFVDAINKLGGPQKATPKTLREAMGLEELNLRQVKSHLQKYRMGKLTVRDWPELPEIRTSGLQLSTKPSVGTSMGNLPFQGNGHGKYKGYKVKKTDKPEMEGQGQGQICMKLKNAENQRRLNGLIKETQKKLADQYNGGADTDAAGIPYQDLAGENSTVIIPSFHSIPENIFPKYNTLDKIKEYLSVQKQVSGSATYQLQNVTHSATGDFITSQGYSCPAHNPTAAINVHASLQGLTPSFLCQIEAYTSPPQSAVSDFQPQSSAYAFHSQNVPYSASNDFPTSTRNYLENTEYLRNFQPQTASYTFHSQNARNDYQPQNAYYPFQLQNTSYDYQPLSSAYVNQLQNAAYGHLPQNAAADVLQPQNAASTATTNFPTSNVSYSDTVYLDDLTATLAAIGSTSIGTPLDDPVDKYMVWDNPEPNAKDNENNGRPM